MRRPRFLSAGLRLQWHGRKRDECPIRLQGCNRLDPTRKMKVEQKRGCSPLNVVEALVFISLLLLDSTTSATVEDEFVESFPENFDSGYLACRSRFGVGGAV